MLAFPSHTSYHKGLNKVLSFVVMGMSKDVLCISLCHVWNVCVHVCKTINWLFICCLIICNYIYIVVIHCGWNNNVAVQIVACWNSNIYTSSWLVIDTVSLSLLYTLDVSHSDESVKGLWVGQSGFRLHLLSNGAALTTQSHRSLTSYAISHSLSQMNRLR